MPSMIRCKRARFHRTRQVPHLLTVPLLLQICGSCVNSPGFFDAKNYSCSSWTGYTCDQKLFPDYSANEIAAVQNECPVSCRLCSASHLACVDDDTFRDPVGDNCATWGLRQGCGVNEAFERGVTLFDLLVIRRACPISCNLSECNGPAHWTPYSKQPTIPCNDDELFVDSLGWKCSNWSILECGPATWDTGHVNYSVNAFASVLVGCPFTCDTWFVLFLHLHFAVPTFI